MSTNTEVVQELYGAMARGDIPFMYEHASPDVRFFQGGRFPTAGAYDGREAMFGHLMEFMTIVGGQFSIDVKDLCASADRVAAVITVTMALGASSLSFDEIHLWRLADGVVVQIDAIPFDPYVIDAFFAEHHRATMGA